MSIVPTNLYIQRYTDSILCLYFRALHLFKNVRARLGTEEDLIFSKIFEYVDIIRA